MKTIYLIRHAKATGQEFSAVLTKEGHEQARKLVDLFHEDEIDVIYSSPFTRAIDTINPLSEHKGIPIIEDERLGERVLSSESYSDWKDKLKDSFDDWDLEFPGGESNRQGYKRAAEMVEKILRDPHEKIILVSHGNLSTLLLHYFDKKSGFEELFALSNPDVYRIEIGEEETTIERTWS
ncbi:2,3-bisphosphoglycerate-dependent phosphoglycerate mutase [Bacillus pakistanensis]|uniref:2,3-bisphosphoglycerate-dependent phosphoglycerate mutase n=1 Tax=Rossellomorea pakistanensis TaxID=992288 RepID=A0ABS2N9L5_9BACI|nr:histidine phosphatase family protein [Bacillus pakistanensis]MBM7584533.1 2,3-bisphosphoglycerate-dependent phosphoglycerate mutase [Bacillus pakistanensis]